VKEDILAFEQYFSRYELFHVCIIPHFHEEMFICHLQYCLLIKENVYQFYLHQLNIICYLSFYHSTAILRTLNFIIIWIAHYQPDKIAEFNDVARGRMLRMIPDKHFEFKHLNLLFSACLRLETRHASFAAVLRFVCEEVRLAHHDIRTLVLGNILYYKLRQLSLRHFSGDEGELRRRLRLRSGVFRHYVKVDVFRLSFAEFFKGLTRRRSKGEMANLGKLYVYQSPLL
jgi:hypothetical protein